MPYDDFGRSIDYPKRKRYREKNPPPMVAVAVVVLIALVALLVAGFLTKKPKSNNEALKRGPTHDSMCVTYTYDGQAIRYYVMTDPDTQRQYIVNDRGGMCLREKRDTPYPETSEKYRGEGSETESETREETQQNEEVTER